MNRPSTSGSSLDRPGVAGRALPAIREVLDQLRSPADERSRARPMGSDARGQVLAVLREQPSSGYGIVRALQQRAGDDAPGAGSVYPMLQLLADEGLVTAEETEAGKVWTLTAGGEAAADAESEREAPAAADSRTGALPRTTAQLVQTAVLVSQTGTPQQRAEAAAAIDETRRRLIAILARD